MAGAVAAAVFPRGEAAAARLMEGARAAAAEVLQRAQLLPLRQALLMQCRRQRLTQVQLPLRPRPKYLWRRDKASKSCYYFTSPPDNK